MVPVVNTNMDFNQQPTNVVAPSPKGINLAMLIDFLLQKTYHDITVLSELLPRKSDIERKIEIIKFATRVRQQFIRLLALVKWASSAEKVDKCQVISTYLDQKNAYFIDTADVMVRIARETLVQARLPNFSLPTAVDVLTTRTFNRLPKCIKTRILPDDPISDEDKVKTIQRLNDILQHRLVASKIPAQFSTIKITDGKVIITVNHEFEVMLMVTGDNADVPWVLLNIEFLMNDFETSDGKSLVHGMQVHYIHQIVQGRLAVEENPLMDLYQTLHYFCLSLQLEVFFTQANRLIRERWGEYVKIEEYVNGQKLKISYCRCPGSSQQVSNTNKTVFPSILISIPANDHSNLTLKHSPELDDVIINKKSKSKTADIFIPVDCLSIEKLFSETLTKYSLYLLRKLKEDFNDDLYMKSHSIIDEDKLSLNVILFECDDDENLLKISTIQKTGQFVLENFYLKSSLKRKLEPLLNSDLKSFVNELHKARLSLYLSKCKQDFSMSPFSVSNTLPITNLSEHQLSKLPSSKLILQLESYIKYALVLTFELDSAKNFVTKFFLLKLHLPKQPSTNQNDAPNTMKFIASSMNQINTANIFKLKHTIQRKRKAHEDESKKLNFVSPQTLCERGLPLHLVKYISHVIMMRLPFIEVSEELSKRNISYNKIEHIEDFKFNLQVINIPSSNEENILTNCNIMLNEELSMWKVSYSIIPPQSASCKACIHEDIEFMYTMTDAKIFVDRMLADWNGICKLYEYMGHVDDIFEALQQDFQIQGFQFSKYDVKSLIFHYGPNFSFKMLLTYNSTRGKFDISFGETGVSKLQSPHHLVKKHITDEFNAHLNLQYVLKIIHCTYEPLNGVVQIPVLPSLGISNRVNYVNNNFTVVVNSSTQIKIIYGNNYILDVCFMASTVLIRDNTMYRTDDSKAMRGFTSIPQLSTFLQLYTEKGRSSSGGIDYPFTPAGSEYDQQNEHFAPASQDVTTNIKDRSIRSPAIVISSPSQPGSHFTAPSPGNPYSAPSPGTFIQPSPVMNLSAMSPSTWPGSPPLVQGSPRTGRQVAGLQAQRQLLTSINVSHSPVPSVLTHKEFVNILTPKENESNSSRPKLCPLERFFGCVMLRLHLLRVLRTDDTLKLERSDGCMVTFSASGKSGFESGLQYSVRLNEQTMDNLILKVAPMKGHENNWQPDDLRTLEHFFATRVVCAPYKLCALTAFARVLGAQPKFMKDFIRIMKLELQTDWSQFLFKVEWCLVVPPTAKPFMAVPGTPAVILKNQNHIHLIFLQLTEVKNEENTFTATIVHDVKSNTVHHIPLSRMSESELSSNTWEMRALLCFENLLSKISEQISKKDLPIYCAVYTALMKMHVPER